MLLQYQSITIRRASAQDAHQLACWWNDGSVMAHAGFPLGVGTTPEKIAADLSHDSDDTRRRLILLMEDKPIGEMCYYHINQETAEIGIKICDSSYQEKGIGRIALSMLIYALFGRGYQKIILDTNLNNTRAQHVYEKLGFRKVQVNLDSWQNQLGNWESSVDYAIVPMDFHNFAV